MKHFLAFSTHKQVLSNMSNSQAIEKGLRQLYEKLCNSAGCKYAVQKLVESYYYSSRVYILKAKPKGIIFLSQR